MKKVLWVSIALALVLFSSCSVSDDQAIQAVKDGKVSIIKAYLREKPESVNAKSSFGYTLLQVAVMSKKIEMVRFLLANGADMEARDSSGQTALHVAASIGATEEAKALIDAGADIRAKILTNRGDTALHVAAKSGSVEIARLLVEKGLEVDSLNSQKITPLNWAAFIGTQEMVEYLVSVGGSLDIIDNYGDTPLTSAAARSGDSGRKILKYLQGVAETRAAKADN